MNFNYKNIFKAAVVSGLCLTTIGCTEYLDKEEQSTVSEKEAFKNFNNFQGYVEDIYIKVPSKSACNWCPTWNWGDDEIMNPEADDRVTHQVDLGNFWAWQQNKCWLWKTDGALNGSGTLYPNMWLVIRRANMGLETLDLMDKGEEVYAGTQEEMDILRGQLLFFRAWWHFEMSCYVGGLPYITRSFGPTESIDEPRLSFQETAKKCAEDFLAAAELLPIDWDETEVGAATKNNNDMRVNKITALSYAGKALLWAASPLAENGAQLGAIKSGKTYAYNAELAKQAADVFGKVVDMTENGTCQYHLSAFEYTDIYNHKNGGAVGEWTQNFYTLNSGKVPGTCESIFRGVSTQGDFNASNWNHSKVWGPKKDKLVEHDNIIHQITGNYVHYAYGMANGLPLDDPESGFDPNHPWMNRDPRFYHDIIFDGFKYINGEPGQYADQLYCSLYTGGLQRDVAISSRTGYFFQKFAPHTMNAIDKEWEWGSSFYFHLPYMRLSDVYLMYAEALAAANKSATKASATCSLTAEAAVNRIRERCGAGKVASKFVGSYEKFMDEVRRERACELSMEGFRFCDLQRWLLLTESDYVVKKSVEFTRKVQDVASFYTADKDFDPRTLEVVGYHLEEILTRDFDTKHYWFPLPTDQTYYSVDFPQNPGW